jgi:hypothetical protein
MRKYNPNEPIGTRGDGAVPPIHSETPGGVFPEAYRGTPGAPLPGHKAPRPLQHGERIDWKHNTRGGRK